MQLNYLNQFDQNVGHPDRNVESILTEDYIGAQVPLTILRHTEKRVLDIAPEESVAGGDE